ncbi:MAG: ChaN family lipoprotein [Pseudomonadota bacterium]
MREECGWRVWLMAALLAGGIGPAAAGTACPPLGGWADTTGAAIDHTELFADLAEADVVLLGERHTEMDHHHWQLGVVAALYGRHPDLVIGLEMLPRSAQPALDDWVAGRLSPAAFLEASDWYSHWGFDPDLYWPILNFARVHGVPLVGLNAERAVVQRLGTEGWGAVPAAERHDVSAPAEPPEAYRTHLRELFERHPAADIHGEFERFLGTQLAWDRMMAASIADTLASAGEEPPLMVGLIGRGHLRYGHGVPHQLADLGVRQAPVLLPQAIGDDCSAIEPGLARAVFGVRAEGHHQRGPMLGVRLVEDEGQGVLIEGVEPDSVADTTGLDAGDRLLKAGGREIESVTDVQRVVGEVVPGLWLPLAVERDGERRQYVARFPYLEE